VTSPDPRVPLNRHALPNFRATVDDLGECYLDHPRWRDGVLLSIPQLRWLLAEGPALLAEMEANATAAIESARKAKR
jgi:hypothetical protein